MNSLVEFIPGIYVRYFNNEMRSQYDTLHIVPMDESSTVFKIRHSFSFQKKLNGQVFPWESKKEEWIGVLDKATGVIHEQRKGKVLSFVVERNILYVGTAEFKKIKITHEKKVRF